MVAELKLDVLDLAGDLQLLDQLCVVNGMWRNGVLLRSRPTIGGP
jgi:hypothetical protein